MEFLIAPKKTSVGMPDLSFPATFCTAGSIENTVVARPLAACILRGVNLVLSAIRGTVIVKDCVGHESTGSLQEGRKLAQLSAREIACSVVIVAPFAHSNSNTTSPS
jgi:hypothetical protein